MIPSALVTDLSRLQFAFTAIFHFLFVPLTLGLTWILVIMEGAYLKTGKAVYKDMTRFWGKLLAINFAIGIIGGITMEFEFGLNWAYFSRMIGGSFGPILAIEGITAFMLEATMFGLFFFTWDKLSRTAHFMVTFFMALGASLSIVNILAANSWMQHPIATEFHYQNMTLQLQSITALYLNFLAQVRIGHVAFAGFLVASIFVMGISAFYILQGRDMGFAKRSFAVAVGFGLICSLMVVFFGDQNGLEVTEQEPEKMAAIEAQWQTQKAPTAWYLLAWPDQETETNRYTLSIPWALSLIATHSFSGTVEGVQPIVNQYKNRIQKGLKAYQAMHALWNHQNVNQNLKIYHQYKDDLGFAYLLEPFAKNIMNPTAAEITQAAKSGIPNVMTAFWTFRIMIGLWWILFILLIYGLVYVFKNNLEKHRFFLRCCMWCIPLPFLAAECGWILAEVGRQPWAVHDILPVFLSASSLDAASLITSLILFVIFYGILMSVELFLMFKFARLGPSSLQTGRYSHEN